MIECDMCHKGVIRITQKGEEIKCKYCDGTGKLETEGEYKINSITEA